MHWRKKVCEVAGYGDILKREGFGGDTPWPADDPLVTLLAHSDCEGDILSEHCSPLADRLESLLPALTTAEWGDETKRFIDGLRLAASRKENVNFH